MKATPSVVDRFADISIIGYPLPSLEGISPQTAHLIYALSEAALCGRDIFYAQNYRYNLMVRHTLEAIYTGCASHSELAGFLALESYLKRVWFANGIHHHNSGDKMVPGFTEPELSGMARIAEVFHTLPWLSRTFSFDMGGGMPPVSMTAWENICDILFRPGRSPKSVSKEVGSDRLLASSCNYYRGVSEKEAIAFYEAMAKPEDEPLSYGLNSLLYRDAQGELRERVYRVGGLYGKALERINYWLLKAAESAETPLQATALEWLIRYYETGNLRAFNEYNKAWVSETGLSVDFINGFIEVYGDPLGRKASWESVVFVKDKEASRRTEALSREAGWFEAHAPVADAYKKSEVKGVTASVISVIMLGGDCAPASPLGINLPNANWIRSRYGSKSVTLQNIGGAIREASAASGLIDEFAATPEEAERARRYGNVASNLHTDLHECLGHGSGRLLPGVSDDALGPFHSVIEEARADLFALYFLADPKMEALGLVQDSGVAMAAYDNYFRNALLIQLARVDEGKLLEQAHMRNRHLIASWCIEQSKGKDIVHYTEKEGKTFVIIADYEALRGLFARLLAEVQRITSEGDRKAAEQLVETWGVRPHQAIHKQVLERYAKLNISPYYGFVVPVLKPQYNGTQFTGLQFKLDETYVSQMLRFGRDYALLDPLEGV